MNSLGVRLFLLCFIASVVLYVYGAFSVMYKWPPYTWLKKIKGSDIEQAEDYSWLGLDRGFENEMIPSQKYPAVESYEEVTSRVNTYCIKLDSIETSYKRIAVIHTAVLADSVYEVIFKIDSRVDTAYAYFKPSLNSTSRSAIFIIPGSGINQSSEIYTKVSENYQANIDDIAIDSYNIFILVKPNEDFLAIHNGTGKIMESYYIPHLLNSGCSYSSYYFIQSLAISKALKAQYSKLVISGLSQGGYVALLNSLQSEPSKTIVASGYSYLMDGVFVSGLDQFIIHGLNKVYNSVTIHKQLEKMETNFLFTWGNKERGLYGLEARQMITGGYMKDLINVRCVSHPEKHVYYEPIIREFLTGE